MLRCSDDSIYTGMTNNLEKRLEEHLSKSKKGAKYTKSHNVIKLEMAWRSKDKSLACKLEYQIKNLTKQQKEDLINDGKLKNYMKDERLQANKNLRKYVVVFVGFEEFYVEEVEK